jgi:hypothetical protein
MEQSYECDVCFGTYNQTSGVLCKLGHFLCGNCFNEEVKSQASLENRDNFKEAQLRVMCRSCSKGTHLDIAANTRHLKEDGFLAYLYTREALVLEESEQRAKEQIDKLQDELRALRLLAGGDFAVEEHKRHITEDILALKCPRETCRCSFEFDGDSAVTCRACGCAFCVYCFQEFASSRDAHSHVPKCERNISSDHGFFLSAEVFERVKKDNSMRQLRRYLAENVDAAIRARVVRAVIDDLARLGIGREQLI